MIKNLIIKYGTIISNVTIAYCFTLMLTFNRTIQVVNVETFFKVFVGDSLTSIVIFLLSLYYLQKNKSGYIGDRDKKIINIFSIIFAFMYIVGSDITYTHSTLRGVTGKLSIACFIVLIIVSFITIKRLLYLLYNKYSESNLYDLENSKKFNRKKYFRMLIPFIVIRIIFYIVLFPGITTWDGMYIIGEGLGYYPFSNSHPYIYTYIVSLFTKFGWKVFGGVGIGVAIFNFITMIVTSIVVVYVLYRIFEIFKVNIWLKRGIYVYYALFPNFIITSFTLYKDTHLMNFLLLFFLCMVLIMYKPDEFFSSKYSLIIFTISFFGVYMLHRKAVIYVVVGIISLLIYNKSNKRKIATYSMIALVVTLILNGIGLQIFKPAESNFKYDYLSPRFQQLAAAVHYHPESFTKKELEFYDSTLGLNNNKNFSYHIADPIKQKMKNSDFQGKSDEFFKIWWKGYKQHPKTYIDAVLNLSVSYWYPYDYADMAYVSNYYYSMYKGDTNWFGDEEILDNNWKLSSGEGTVNRFYNMMNNLHWTVGELSIVGIFYRSGMYSIGLMIILLLSILRKNNKIMPLILLTVSVVLTCIYSPLANYFRYSYIYIMLVPLLIPMLYAKINKKGSF